MLRAISQHKVMVTIVIVCVVAALWYGMSGSSSPEPTIIASNADGTPVTQGGSAVVPGSVDADTKNILSILLALRSVKLDSSIFSNPAYISLKDFSTEIVPEPIGRPDPFAPLGVGGSLPTGAKAQPAQKSTGQ